MTGGARMPQREPNTRPPNPRAPVAERIHRARESL